MARKKIGEILVAAGAATENQVKKALGHQRNFPNQRLGEVLCALEGMSKVALGRALAEQFNLPYTDLPPVEAGVGAIVPLDFQSEHRVVPFRLEVEGKSERLHLAVADPSNLSILDDLRFQLRKSVRVYVAPMDQIDDHLRRVRGEEPKLVEPIPLAPEGDGDEMQLESGGGGAHNLMSGWFTVAPSEVDPSANDLDVLLGNPSATPVQAQPAPPAAAPNPTPLPQFIQPQEEERREPTTPRAEVTMFQPPPEAPKPPPPAAQAESDAVGTTLMVQRSPPQGSLTPREFSVDEVKILEQIEKLAAGESVVTESEKVKPERMVAALVRLLMKKGMIQELEFLDELAKK